MDATIKQILSSFEVGLNNYKDKLGETNEKLKKALDIFQKLNQLAESAKDMMDFYAKPEANSLLGDLSALMPELAKEKPLQGIRNVPAASAVASGYHMAYDQIPKDQVETRKIYERVFELEKAAENALVFLRMMAEEGLFLKMSRVPIMESQNRALDNAKNLAQPVMVNYHEKTLAQVSQAKSLAELEYLSNLQAEISIYQNLWDTSFLNISALLIGNAISSWILTHDEADRQEVENSYRFIAEFYGVDFDTLFKIPRIWDYFCRILFNSLKKDLTNKGVDSAEKMLAWFKSVLEECVKGKDPVKIGAESNQKLVLWGIPTHLNEVETGFKVNFDKKK